MKPLELDFERPRRPSRLMQWLLFAIALAFAGDVAFNHVRTREAVDGVRARLAQQPGPREDRTLLKVAAQPVSDEEYAAARDTIRRLSTPWTTLFEALEAARIESVSIVSVEPDPLERTVQLRGDAKDYLSALSFVANLREQPALKKVHLVRHEPASADAKRAVQFTISASWGGRS